MVERRQLGRSREKLRNRETLIAQRNHDARIAYAVRAIRFYSSCRPGRTIPAPTELNAAPAAASAHRSRPIADRAIRNCRYFEPAAADRSNIPAADDKMAARCCHLSVDPLVDHSQP